MWMRGFGGGPIQNTLRRIEAPRQWLHTRRRIEASAVAVIVKRMFPSARAR
jgi:hypothetical protein